MTASLQRLTNLADSMRVPGSDSELTKYIAAATDALSLLGVTALLDSGTKRNVADYLHFAVDEMITEIEQMEEIAAKNGYFLPDDPFVELRNSTRKNFKIIEVSQTKADQMYQAVKQLVEIYSKWKSGEINLLEKESSLAQISSFDVSVDGYGSTGDPISDILGYSSDADAIKRIGTIKALSDLDFSKRKPTLIFVADVGEKASEGVVVAWKKMNDAFGYNLKIRNVFQGTEKTTFVRNPQISKEALSVSIDATSFYDDLKIDNLVLYEDKEAIDHMLFAYSISAVQKKSTVDPTKIINVKKSKVILTAKQIESLTQLVENDSKQYGRDIESISPYPSLSLILFGDPQYAWMISAINVKEKIDKDKSARSVSYIGSSLSSIIDEINSNNLFAPDDVESVSSSLEEVINSHGIQSAILSVLDICGITLFITDKDDPAGFQSTQEAMEAAEGPLRKIISSIDPETATLDPLVAISNLTRSSSPKKKVPNRIIAYSPGTSTIKFIDIIGKDLIDLTTSDGIGRFVDIVRAYYDVSFVRT